MNCKKRLTPFCKIEIQSALKIINNLFEIMNMVLNRPTTHNVKCKKKDDNLYITKLMQPPPLNLSMYAIMQFIYYKDDAPPHMLR